MHICSIARYIAENMLYTILYKSTLCDVLYHSFLSMGEPQSGSGKL